MSLRYHVEKRLCCRLAKFGAQPSGYVISIGRDNLIDFMLSSWKIWYSAEWICDQHRS